MNELMGDEELLARAIEAMGSAHSPYSKIRVGAAALDHRGRVHVGCNVENASLGLTVCAERVALWSATAVGAGRITRLAIASDHQAVASPCGACRQVLLELAPEARILFGDSNGVKQVWESPADLLPDAFDGNWMS